MFTGIVGDKGTVVSVERQLDFIRLVISIAAKNLVRLNIGASIAVNGVCLTVTSFEVKEDDVVGQIVFDVIDETLKLTNLGRLKQGDFVNIERSVTFGTEIGGHIVSGHVQTTALIKHIESNEKNCNIRLQLDPKWMAFVLFKGFISIDGISLTVGEVFSDGFMIHLIPETLQVTNLARRKVNDLLNIEVDQQTYTIVKTVERVLAQKQFSAR